MKEIKFVIPEQGEKVLGNNMNDLHEELLKLPADMYINLYHMMKYKMENSYFVSNGCISTGVLSNSGVTMI